jgi:hypothetical protein
MRARANYDLTHNEIQGMLLGVIRQFTDTAYPEYTLPNGKKADIACLYKEGTAVIEVKTNFQISLLDSAITKYAECCIYLFYATNINAIPNDLINRKEIMGSGPRRRVGLIEVGSAEIRLIRNATRL